VVKLGGWVAKLGRWVDKFLARLLARQLSGLESRHLSKIQHGRHKQTTTVYKEMREYLLIYDFFNSVEIAYNCSQMPKCCAAALTGFEHGNVYSNMTFLTV
jgi:hypothetical protein